MDIDAATIQLQTAIIEVKHLAGQHNQQSHAGDESWTDHVAYVFAKKYGGTSMGSRILYNDKSVTELRAMLKAAGYGTNKFIREVKGITFEFKPQRSIQAGITEIEVTKLDVQKHLPGRHDQHRHAGVTPSIPTLLNNVWTGTHISSNVDSLKAGFELRDLGVSIARTPNEENSVPTIQDQGGEMAKVYVTVTGRGLDYGIPTHRRFIDRLVDIELRKVKRGEKKEASVIPILRSLGIDWVNGMLGSWGGVSPELHVIDQSKIHIDKVVPVEINIDEWGRRTFVEKHLPGQHNQDDHAGHRSAHLELTLNLSNALRKADVLRVDLIRRLHVAQTPDQRITLQTAVDKAERLVEDLQKQYDVARQVFREMPVYEKHLGGQHNQKDHAGDTLAETMYESYAEDRRRAQVTLDKLRAIGDVDLGGLSDIDEIDWALRSIDEMLQKHLPGRHDQKTHGRKGTEQAQPYTDYTVEVPFSMAEFTAAVKKSQSLAFHLKADYGLKKVTLTEAMLTPKGIADTLESLTEITEQIAEIKRLVPNIDFSYLSLRIIAPYSGTNAHYMPQKMAIRILGSNGQSFAHEIGHYIDNLMGYRVRGLVPKPGLTLGSPAGYSTYVAEMQGRTMAAADYKQHREQLTLTSDIVATYLEADSTAKRRWEWADEKKPRENPYWTNSRELFARAFDQYLGTKSRVIRTQHSIDLDTRTLFQISELSFYKSGMNDKFERLFKLAKLKSMVLKAAMAYKSLAFDTPPIGAEQTFDDEHSAQLWLAQFRLVPVISNSPIDVEGARYAYFGLLKRQPNGKITARLCAAEEASDVRLEYGDTWIYGAGGVLKHLPGQHDQKKHAHVVYHGTAADYVKSILERGIVTNLGIKNWNEDYYGRGRGRSVYMSPDPAYAASFGYDALRHVRGWGSRGKVALFKIRVPEEVKLLVDEKAQRGFLLPHKVKPEWIEGYALLSIGQAITSLPGDKFDFTPVIHKTEADKNVFYVPVIFLSDDIEEKHLAGRHDQKRHAGSEGHIIIQDPGTGKGAPGVVAESNFFQTEKEEVIGEAPGGINAARLLKVTRSDGVVEKVIAKRPGGSDTKNELLAYKLSTILDVNVPHTEVSGAEVRQEFVEGAKTGSEYLAEVGFDVEKEKELFLANPRVGILDFLMAQEDRHRSNYLVVSTGKPIVIPIDNGNSAFPNKTYELSHNMPDDSPFVYENRGYKLTDIEKNMMSKIKDDESFASPVRMRADYLYRSGAFPDPNNDSYKLGALWHDLVEDYYSEVGR